MTRLPQGSTIVQAVARHDHGEHQPPIFEDGSHPRSMMFTNSSSRRLSRKTAALLTAFGLALPLAIGGCASSGSSLGGGNTTPVSTPKPGTIKGQLSDGASYLIQIPENWNGTLALFSHGLRCPTEENPATDAPNPETADWLLGHGYALAGSSYAHTGWAVEDALRDQLDVVTAFESKAGKPRRVIAWGESLGGLVSAALVEQHPERISAALPMCAVGAGSVGTLNSQLDAAFVLTSLLAPGADSPQLTHVTDPVANAGAARGLVETAAGTPQGRARLALVAAVAQLPGAIHPDAPTPTDLDGRLNARLEWLHDVPLLLWFAERADVEARAGGNPSTNVGVDYGQLLRASGQRDDVAALYRSAGLDLDGDLARLAAEPRIQADPVAVDYATRNVTLDGRLSRPVLTLHNVSDGLLPSSQERAYADTVAAAGAGGQLRQLFVDRPGHCLFTPAESLAAFSTLVDRLDRGQWGDITPASLDAAATAFGPALNTGGGNPVPPAFTAHSPAAFPRPYDAAD